VRGWNVRASSGRLEEVSDDMMMSVKVVGRTGGVVALVEGGLLELGITLQGYEI
jgi:hypothetical protein